jgi:very-short-patch-repair endonuclease
MSHVKRVAAAAKVRFAREQRQKPTPGEEALWERLRGGRLGARFRRQHPLGDFVLDFYCESAHLAVEVDGLTHDERRAYDEWRDEQLAIQRIRVVRVSAEDVQRDLAGVLARIKASLTP